VFLVAAFRFLQREKISLALPFLFSRNFFLLQLVGSPIIAENRDAFDRYKYAD